MKPERSTNGEWCVFVIIINIANNTTKRFVAVTSCDRRMRWFVFKRRSYGMQLSLDCCHYFRMPGKLTFKHWSLWPAFSIHNNLQLNYELITIPPKNEVYKWEINISIICNSSKFNLRRNKPGVSKVEK